MREKRCGMGVSDGEVDVACYGGYKRGGGVLVEVW